MTPTSNHIKAIENVLRRRGIDLCDQDVRGFMELGGAVDDHLWCEICDERQRLANQAITMEPLPWWRERLEVPVYSVGIYAMLYIALLWAAYR